MRFTGESDSHFREPDQSMQSSREVFWSKNREELVEEFGFDQEIFIAVLAGISTWKGEEKLLVEYRASFGDLKTLTSDSLIIPRHAERRGRSYSGCHLRSCRSCPLSC